MARLPEYLIAKTPIYTSDGEASIEIEINYQHPELWRSIWRELKAANRDKSNTDLMIAARLLVKEKHRHGCIGRCGNAYAH